MQDKTKHIKSMNLYTTLLFDLDGTLTDPREGITRAFQYALRKMGQEPPPCEELLCCIGPPLLASFQKLFGMSEEKAREATACYREYFGERGIYENRVYPGIPELLGELRGAGYRLVLATAKPEIYAGRILRYFGLMEHFELVVGANFDNTRIYKHEVIGHAVALLRDTPREAMVMIGDREDDVLGARRHGLATIAVGFGYGTPEELKDAEPTHLAETLEDLRLLLLNTTD